MLKNYIKIAWRNLSKHKLFSFINIVGLGIAIPFVLLALIQLQSSYEFDNFHQDTDRLVRVITDDISKEGIVTSCASSPYALSDKLKSELSGVENATKVVRDFGWVLSNRLKTQNVNTIYTEPQFFDMFNFPLEQGAYPSEPNTLVLSNEMADRFFGDANPVGKSLEHQDLGSFRITGVLKEYKTKTQFKSDVMVSMSTFDKFKAEQSEEEKWSVLDSHTFLKTVEGTDLKKLNIGLEQIANQASKSFLLKVDKQIELFAQPFDSISPARTILENNPYVEDFRDILFNFSIPLMILLLAAFNYVNLTLARSLSRSKEVGVRKVMGAVRSQLIGQFLSEAVIISFFSLLIGLFLLWVAKNNLHVGWITWEVDHPWAIILSFAMFTLFLGLLAGISPAAILSRFQPAKVLKGELSPASFGKIGFRRVLMVIQFTVTLGFVFVIGHLINQFEYMATENENFNRKGIYNLSLKEGTNDFFHSEILSMNEVQRLGYVSQVFGNMPARVGLGREPDAEKKQSFYYAADAAFIDNMELNFLAGENLPSSQRDSSGGFVVINEKAVDALLLGSPEEAIGQQVYLETDQPLIISGVIKNFCHFNYQYQILPVVFQYNPQAFRVAAIRTNEMVDQANFEDKLDAVWNKEYPYDEAHGSWLADDLYERYYPVEDMKIMGITSVIIFVIALMGMLGMLIYTTEKRVKEIGIRKVMGAEIRQIIVMFAWSFLKLLLVASAIAVPFGVFFGLFMNVQLFKFNGGLNYGYMTFILLTVLLIAGGAVGFFSYKSATVNPVKSLRNE
ncbi:ABC transporter permease [Jiulongibacter sediminis]|uniref:ABC transporter permease n=1 Tax=Jiulongibacter sediminis TaxID=1605367 RepID=A0A0P7C1V1_9BACT|nr:ABC transporter permease [Jiulongibacter sediminis]KPM47294.1 hypothetical protein AFM12_15980 [Jiulongibacter sediminis]TBX22852.1 hypothetical protein TK44_15990 [Jiulongibacter sediminis]